MNKKLIYKLLLVLSIICLTGTTLTNVQQFVQYSKVEEHIKEYKAEKQMYEERMLLYETGLIAQKPIEPHVNAIVGESHIRTPYNCLNVPVSIIFWTLAFISVVIFTLSCSINLHCSKTDKIKLYILSSLALTSTAVGTLYWVCYFHS